MGQRDRQIDGRMDGQTLERFTDPARRTAGGVGSISDDMTTHCKVDGLLACYSDCLVCDDLYSPRNTAA